MAQKQLTVDAEKALSLETIAKLPAETLRELAQKIDLKGPLAINQKWQMAKKFI